SLNKRPEPIAVVGVSARFPMAKNIEEFWNNLKSEKNCITELPKERWNMEPYFETNKEKTFQEGKSYCKWGGFLEDFDKFDPLFFNIPPAEAERMDPQERIFLEECWKAVEDAGYVPSKMTPEQKKKIGVYGAITKTGFMLWNMKSNKCYNTSFSSFVNRVSYFMDFSGPSKAVDTMCSSSIVALHEACEGLRKGNIETAVVGGANLYLHPYNFVLLSQARMIADSDESSVFKKGGIGFTPSEGVGAVVLKRLSDAKRDHNAIWAVIRGSAVMHSGRTNGYSVPDPGKLAEVMNNAICNAQIEPKTIRHIEAAANGSEMTDAIEMSAISKVFDKNHNTENGYYTISSVKSMLGHGEAVSGLAQFIKAIMQLKYKMLCPMTMPKELNPNIDFENFPFKVKTGLSKWTESYCDDKKIPRRIGINSLGAGGVYAHVILEEYICKEEMQSHYIDTKPKLFLFSAKTENSLEQYLVKWKNYISENPELDLYQLSYILQNKREAMKKRFATIARNHKELLQNIEDFQNHIENRNNYSDTQSVIKNTETNKQIVQCLKERNLEQLAHMWILHMQIPWEQLYSDDIPNHISMLPTYPFKKKSFWIETEEQETDRKQAEPENSEEDGYISLEDSFISLEDILKDTKFDKNWKKQKDSHNYVTATELQQLIKKLLYEILYLDEFDEFDEAENFMELGLDSVYTIEFIKRFNEETGLNLKETVIFSYPNTIELAEYATNAINMRG
ncbi:MAG: beta-ketoacyl synthase N-terminal-like domain-containing protein, partial [Acutalibacteraceae bacterium]|nr:beta-ketoacyl synthase N-terminal-like domain-containing protein [Acutalibacteraceae bacterium]